MSNLYNTIKSECQKKGISVSALCLKTGMSKSIMSELKAGRKQTLNITTLKKMADYLEIPVSTFLGEEPLTLDKEFAEELQMLRDDPKVRTLMHSAKGLSSEQIELVNNLMRQLKGDD